MFGRCLDPPTQVRSAIRIPADIYYRILSLSVHPTGSVLVTSFSNKRKSIWSKRGRKKKDAGRLIIGSELCGMRVRILKKHLLSESNAMFQSLWGKVKGIEVRGKPSDNAVKWGEVKGGMPWSVYKLSEVEWSEGPGEMCVHHFKCVCITLNVCASL
jgi:hypothetical protein